MCIEAISTMMLHGCYKATVNEPETITEAQRVCSVHRRIGLRTCGSQSFGREPSSNGAELGSVRKCWIALRARPGDFARPQFHDSRAFLPVSHRTIRRRQDLAAAAVVPVAAADPGPGQPVRSRRLAARQG